MDLSVFGRGWCSETIILTSCGEKGWSEEGESGTQCQKLHQGTIQSKAFLLIYVKFITSFQ